MIRSSEEADTVETSHENSAIEALNEAGFDTAAGLRYAAGDRDFYLELAAGFAESAAQKQTAIREDWQRQDWADYQIRVHALKSTARQIGANALYELAQEQELAAKERNTPEIEAGAEKLLQSYEHTVKCLREILHLDAETKQAAEGSQNEMPVEDLICVLKEAKTCIENFEAERALEVLRPLASASFADSAVSDALRGIMEALESFDTFTAEENLNALMERIEK